MRTMTEEWHRKDYVISSDPDLLDLDIVYGFLQRSY